MDSAPHSTVLWTRDVAPPFGFTVAGITPCKGTIDFGSKFKIEMRDVGPRLLCGKTASLSSMTIKFPSAWRSGYLLQTVRAGSDFKRVHNDVERKADGEVREEWSDEPRAESGMPNSCAYSLESTVWQVPANGHATGAFASLLCTHRRPPRLGRFRPNHQISLKPCRYH